MEELTITQMLMQQVLPQLITAVGLGLGVLVVWLRSKTAKTIRANVKNELIQKATLWANGLIMDLVGEASQTTVRELKQKLADGKVTEDEYRDMMAVIKKDMLAKLSELTMGRLLGDGVVSDALKGQELISSKIEAAIPLVKAAQAAATSGGPIPKDPQES